ncbi:hypothetical protein [Nocardioides sp. 503]|uniref:hypothetical protein n=1 Tax=Nocardioides sp. 503 TaxID=2508326 RepID=UPI0010701E61|nr:hypothetical protein [Nocardioides sp. 503]
MELQEIVERYADSLAEVDATTTVVGVNARTKVAYQPGIQPMTESVVVPLMDAAWETLYADERSFRETEVSYPTTDVPSTTKLDHIFTTDGLIDEPPEWGVEVKRLQFVGDNGKNGDHETAKMLSPYLKDRGVLHDALRLREYGWTRRIAVVGYGFDYDETSLDHAATLHTTGDAAMTVKNIRSIVKNNGPLYYRPLIEFADSILRLRGWTIGPRAEASFEAWRHPSGGTGIVFGWEIRRPQWEKDYDPRHPW